MALLRRPCTSPKEDPNRGASDASGSEVGERQKRARFIDTDGELVFELDDAFWVEPFSEGRAKVTVRDRETGVETVGYIDENGTFVIPPGFVAGGTFHGGLAFVVECGRSGYIDRDGRAVWGLAPPRATGTAGRIPESEVVTATLVANAIGFDGELELVENAVSRDCTPYGKVIWSKTIRYRGGEDFPRLSIRLLVGDTFLSADREQTYEAVAARLPAGKPIPPIVSRISIEGGPDGYFAVSGFGPGGSVYVASAPSRDRRFELQVLAMVASEGAAPADSEAGRFQERLGQNPAEVLSELARAAHEAVFPKED